VAILLELGSDALRIRLTGRDALYALKRSLTVPLGSVAAVRAVDREELHRTKTLRAPGTSVPGRVKAGTFRGTEGKELWDVRRGRRVLELELRGHDYARVVLELPGPDSEAERIRAALPSGGSQAGGS
jgi:hypothetical protein